MMPPSANSDEIMARMAATEAHFRPLIEAEEREALAAGWDGSYDWVPPASEASRPWTADDIPVMPPGVTYVRPMHRPSGTKHVDHLGRDHLGPVLIAGGPRRNRTAP